MGETGCTPICAPSIAIPSVLPGGTHDLPNVGMPHVLWELQGDKTAHVTEQDDGHGNMVKHIELQQGKPGKLSAEENYDKTVADLVSFMVWMGEPVAQERQTIGIWVLVTLAVLFVLALMLKKEYWKTCINHPCGIALWHAAVLLEMGTTPGSRSPVSFRSPAGVSTHG